MTDHLHNTRKLPPRQIIHCDMDAFYASVEMLDNPELLGQPVIVGGTSNRGVVAAASYEARKYGVHSALPIVTARRRCPHGIFVAVRMDRYQEISCRIMALFREYTPLVEPLSLDEAFLDVTASQVLFGPAETIARLIRQRVREETGLTVSAGIASCKMVAKIASDLHKPDGLTVVPAGTEKEFLAVLGIERLWGTGEKTREILKTLGVSTIGELARLPVELLTRKLGQNGAHLHTIAQGIDSRVVEPSHDIKSVGNEETFEQDLVKEHDLRRELLALSAKVGRRLRRKQLAGRTVQLKVKYNDFQQITRSETLPQASADHCEIYRCVLRLLEKTQAGSRPIRLLGVSLANIVCTDHLPAQLDLFHNQENRERRRQLNQAIDAIDTRFGALAVRPATLLGYNETVKERPVDEDSDSIKDVAD